jgi:adenylate cyclase
MADLIAQGPELEHRWRRTLPVDKPIVVGRQSATWSVPWDDRISREHVELAWTGELLKVHALAEAANPVFVRGRQESSFELHPGEHFVVGSTTFSLADDRVNVSLEIPQPVREQAFSSQYLQRMRFRNADQRIENLSRLPEVISSAGNDTELFVRLVNVLLSGVTTADAAAIVAVASTVAGGVRVLHWDQRRMATTPFQPSERLIQEAIRRGESVLHVWNMRGEQKFTEAEGCDWAFCTPALGDACRGWGLYLAGRFAGDSPLTPAPSDSADLRDDLKFTEIVASTLTSLLQLRDLGRRHAGLSQFFSPVVLEVLEAQDPDVALAPRETEVSVLFCDLRGFSLRSEKGAADLLGLLRRVSTALGVMTHQILDHGGVVGDFHGDAAMGFWGWPIAQADSAAKAARAALEIRREFTAAAKSESKTLADFQVGIGVATGRAVAGKIGTADQVKATVFGPVVNLASRLESMTKTFRAPILLDETTARMVRESMSGNIARVRRVARVRPFGMDAAVDVSELLPPLEDYPLLTEQGLRDYEAALAAFEAGEWVDAFDRLHRVPARDKVKDFLTVYIAQHNRTPPRGWDGVIALANK